MKTLLLLRHGKAQNDAPHGDKARHLTGRGRRQAAEMGGRLPEIAGRLDGVVSSDGERALETARIAVASAGYGGELTLEPDIYAADLDTLLNVVRNLPDEDDVVLMVGHNPGFEYLAAALAEEGTQEPALPTGGLAHLRFDATRWRDVRPGTGTLAGVHTPSE